MECEKKLDQKKLLRMEMLRNRNEKTTKRYNNQ